MLGKVNFNIKLDIILYSCLYNIYIQMWENRLQRESLHKGFRELCSKFCKFDTWYFEENGHFFHFLSCSSGNYNSIFINFGRKNRPNCTDCGTKNARHKIVPFSRYLRHQGKKRHFFWAAILACIKARKRETWIKAMKG